MGIKNLMKIIQRYAPEAITNNKINSYKNSIVAIDANLLIYKTVYAIRKNGYDIKNKDKSVTHIFGFLQKIKGFIKYNITPIFVFDGVAPEIKKNTLKQRAEFQSYMQQKYYKAITQDEKKKYYFMKSNISYNEIIDVMELITLFGYTIIEAPGEADPELANLNINKLVDYVITDDMDILIFGGNIMLKNFTVSDKKYIQKIDLNVFKKITSLNQDQLIDLAILLGCDYCPTVKGIGTIGAYNLIQKYKNIENIIKDKNICLPYDYQKARQYFKFPQVVPYNTINIKSLNVDITKFTKFLQKHQFKQDYIENILSFIQTKHV